MALGDLKYGFIDNQGAEQQVVIPAEVMRSGRKEGLKERLIINRWLVANGYDITPIVDEVKPTSSRRRKSNPTKAKLISALGNCMREYGVVDVINAERQLQVEIDSKIFEFTLVQKRTPKEA